MTFILAANWKMNLGIEASANLCSELIPLSKSIKQSELWLTPSYPAITMVKKTAAGSSIKVGAQNAHWADSGAFTGEISCSMLKECGADYAIVGHSERRHVFLETEEMAFKRAEAVTRSGLDLIFCIGETLAERESGKTEAVLATQLSKLPAIYLNKCAEIILAYEPVWAIGTGKVASSEEIKGAHAFINHFWNGQKAGTCPKILYGGSVTGENIKAISEVEHVSGALIGGASNAFTSFKAIIEAVES